ncbi:MAG: alanine--tRNA ligase [Candidatus Margulisbacteria bacterium]|nr:alanine--tRNA ligase [Candidatus Margulisiibacteriota bacterium]
MRSQDVRQTFIDFFVQKKGHLFVPASPVVPLNDPTILFTNAGMNQFKDTFLGKGQHAWKRVANSQPCIRVSGKHNDLEDVGYDGTHLTLFEMLGNWSFGDYYKKEAIVWAWELLTEVFALPKDKLYATVYETDDESLTLWQTVTDIRHDHILKCGKKDNFWEMGEVGPCGPCSEIHVDTGLDDGTPISKDPILGVNGENQRFIEFWNLVFIQYNRLADGTLEDLPQKHVDTGMGLERLASYLQGKTSAYETDLLRPLISEIEMLSGVTYDPGSKGVSHRVMADHIRTVVFSISDNVMPASDGRGYVIRRLLRRALRYATQIGFKEPILYRLVPTLVKIMGDFYPHLAERESFVTQVVRAEEESFLRTLDSGIRRFDDVSKGSQIISGPDAFKLYDTFGFPIDLTQLLARERGLSVDSAGFEVALEEQKNRSRRAAKKEVYVADSDQIHSVLNSDLSTDLHHSPYQGLARGGEARVVVEAHDKLAMARHHTVTHLLQAALRQVLGTHVHQAGSLVDTDRLRFDFTHFQAVSSEQLVEIERLVLEQIMADEPVQILSMSLEEAKFSGAMALFGEKYDQNDVRVVKINVFSTELCGGTHVIQTRMIESFKIVSESAVAAGTRRIEAVAGETLVTAFLESEKQKVEARLKAEKQREEAKRLQKESDKNASEQIRQQLQEYLSKLESISDSFFLLREATSLDMNGLRFLADQLTEVRPDSVAVLAGIDCFVVKVGKQVKPELDARQILNNLLSVAGGRGGGTLYMAQAGGVDSSKREESLRSLSF